MARINHVLISLFPLVSFSSSLLLPNITGPYPVGTIALELINPTASPPRDLMISFFYPTSSHNLTSYPLAADFPDLTAAFEDAQVGVPTGVFESILTQSHLAAPILDPSHFPVLLFSHGLGMSRLLYTALVEDIASRGYIVATVDHPNDTTFIEYPDGRVAEFDVVQFTNFTQPIPYVEKRVSDLRWALDSLSNETFVGQLPGVKESKKSGERKGGCLNIDKVGVFGHSLGGAAAASAMLADHRFVAGINLDGAMAGNVTTLGLSAPFLLMSSAVHNRTNDATWAAFWENLRGYKRDLAVAGTRHLSYSDYATLAGDAVALGLLTKNDTEALVGMIDGTRILQIERAYIRSFFDKWFKVGKGELLDGRSQLFPEVSFDV